MGLFSFTFYKGYFYFIGFWIADSIRSLVERNLEKKEEKPDDEQNKKDIIINIFKLICLNFSDLLAGFLVLYTYIKSFKKKNKTIERESKLILKRRLIYRDLSIKTNSKYLIILSSLLDLIARSVFLIFFISNIKNAKKLDNQQIDWLISLDISSRAIFSRIILKTKLQKHHFVSIYICLIGFILMSTSDIYYLIKQHFNFLYIFFIFPKFILFPFADVINEILLTSHFLLPQILMFVRGVYEFIILFIFCVFYLLFSEISYLSFFSKFFSEIGYGIIFILVCFFRTFCLMKVLYLYNSQHVSFLIIIFPFINFISGLFDGKVKNSLNYNIMQLISLIIIFFGTLLYNEIIIINACGLNENTKKGLLIKEKLDLEQSNSLINPNIDEENNDDIKSIQSMINDI